LIIQCFVHKHLCRIQNGGYGWEETIATLVLNKICKRSHKNRIFVIANGAKQSQIARFRDCHGLSGLALTIYRFLLREWLLKYYFLFWNIAFLTYILYSQMSKRGKREICFNNQNFMSDSVTALLLNILTMTY